MEPKSFVPFSNFPPPPTGPYPEPDESSQYPHNLYPHD
jgi:hypothetical protein